MTAIENGELLKTLSVIHTMTKKRYILFQDWRGGLIYLSLGSVLRIPI